MWPRFRSRSTACSTAPLSCSAFSWKNTSKSTPKSWSDCLMSSNIRWTPCWRRPAGQADVQEPRPGNFDAVDPGRAFKPHLEQLGHLARVLAGRLRELQGDVRRVVAVLLDLRSLDHDLVGVVGNLDGQLAVLHA